VPGEFPATLEQYRPVIAGEQIGYVSEVGAQGRGTVVADPEQRIVFRADEKGVDAGHAHQLVIFFPAEFDQR
jgi:hypothetical protein